MAAARQKRRAIKPAAPGKEVLPPSPTAPMATGLVAELAALHTASATATTPEQLIAELDRNKARRRGNLGRLLEMSFGVRGERLAAYLLGQATNGFIGNDDLSVGLEALVSVGPKTGAQALLATQMLAVHSAATTALRRAANSQTASEVAESSANQAIRLLRLFAEQAELLARLQGQLAHQRVVVETIHVTGGQAAIGAFGPGGGGQ